MKIDDLLKQTCEWLKGSGPNSDIVMSSRVRLARNLERVAFSHWATKKQEHDTLVNLEQILSETDMISTGLKVRMNEIDDVDKQFLLERHLVSREHIVQPDYKSVLIGDKEVISVMVNEEDHLRIQVMQSGFNLQECWRIASRLDDSLQKRGKFAFSAELGYLTACPTNTGTGLRASVMLHLPALVMTKQIGRVLHAISKLGMTARGFYGEGTEAEGNFFQISNQITLGSAEEDIIDNLERIIRQVIGHEENARKTLMKQNREILQDKIWRSNGTLRSAHIMNSKETMALLSMVRLGVDIGLINDIDRRAVNELFILTQPAHLQKIEGRLLSSAQRDVKRANLIRRRLEGL
ncbi:MAG: protein arginine kinase [Candidatus Omnitrophica bacterium CG07_land_8_20_14_0_80_50_8]|nr:MAG: protein arginine kinase [Candidatus Omnitrophica bacterium CG1_02_49_16]PIU40752.1 MAG: protein arginine kinase [Candidatus Omnitrophica bacterium CG07_land_8_20_14_0_80_50_8]